MADVAQTFDDVVRRVADVEGWMTEAQARRLWEAASSVPAGGRIVEIGSFRGRSAIVLASAAREGVEVVAIDPHAGNDRGPQEFDGFVDEASTDHEVFHENLRHAGVDDRVRHVRSFSQEALGDVDGEVDMLYIDGAHRYAPALADIRQWGDRVAPGGALLIHDSFSAWGVTLAILRALTFGVAYRYEGRDGSLARYRKERVRGAVRLGNVVAQLAELPWFASNMARKVLILAKLHPGPWPY